MAEGLVRRRPRLLGGDPADLPDISVTSGGIAAEWNAVPLVVELRYTGIQAGQDRSTRRVPDDRQYPAPVGRRDIELHRRRLVGHQVDGRLDEGLESMLEIAVDDHLVVEVGVPVVVGLVREPDHALLPRAALAPGVGS